MSNRAPYPTELKSRAVKRIVESGNTVSCAHCGEEIKFQARLKQFRVICNVYVGETWNRVEQYHADCYGAAGQPYGPPHTAHPQRVDAKHLIRYLRRQ